MNATLQALLVGLLLAWSLGVALRRVFPQTVRRLQGRLAALATARGHARLGRWLQSEVAASSGCDSGCGSCKTGCASPTPALPATQPLQWRSSSSGGCH